MTYLHRFQGLYAEAKNMAREDLRMNPLHMVVPRGYSTDYIHILTDKRGALMCRYDQNRMSYAEICDKLRRKDAQ